MESVSTRVPRLYQVYLMQINAPQVYFCLHVGADVARPGRHPHGCQGATNVSTPCTSHMLEGRATSVPTSLTHFMYHLTRAPARGCPPIHDAPGKPRHMGGAAPCGCPCSTAKCCLTVYYRGESGEFSAESGKNFRVGGRQKAMLVLSFVCSHAERARKSSFLPDWHEYCTKRKGGDIRRISDVLHRIVQLYGTSFSSMLSPVTKLWNVDLRKVKE